MRTLKVIGSGVGKMNGKEVRFHALCNAAKDYFEVVINYGDNVTKKEFLGRKNAERRAKHFFDNIDKFLS